MDQTLFDVDEQPPYVELYNHHPLMYMSLCNHRQACSETTPKELLHWCHGLQCTIDSIASSFGLYKIKVMGNTGPSCMFTISPDMPPKQQAEVMFNAAKKLRAMLSEVLLPGGDTLNSQITIHAGQYAGGVVGKSSWTYDVFGSDVQDLLDMDQINSPNVIQVSDPALALMNEPQQFAPACKVVCNGRELVLHRWLDQAAAGQAGEGSNVAAEQAAATAAEAKVQPVKERHLQQQPFLPPSPVKPHAAHQQPQQQHQQPFASSKGMDDAAGTGCSPFGSCSSAGPDSSCMRPDLLFTDPSLEEAYLRSQTHQLARMDMVFAVVNMFMMVGFMWGAAHSPLLMLVCCWQWLLPVVAACWYLAAPASYCRRREPLWVLHRVLSALELAGVLLYCVLLRQQSLLHDDAAVGVAAHSALSVQNCVAGMLRRSAVIMLADALGFKVRLRAHLVTVALSAAVTAMGVAWQWSSDSSSGLQRNSLALWDLLVRLSVGCLGPTLLLYRWEVEDRSLFLATRQRDAAAYTAGVGAEVWHGAKAKVV